MRDRPEKWCRVKPPTPAEIKTLAAVIRSGWSPEETERRKQIADIVQWTIPVMAEPWHLDDPTLEPQIDTRWPF